MATKKKVTAKPVAKPARTSGNKEAKPVKKAIPAKKAPPKKVVSKIPPKKGVKLASKAVAKVATKKAVPIKKMYLLKKLHLPKK